MPTCMRGLVVALTTTALLAACGGNPEQDRVTAMCKANQLARAMGDPGPIPPECPYSSPAAPLASRLEQLIAQSTDGTLSISSVYLGTQWPFTVGAGHLVCGKVDGIGSVVVFAPSTGTDSYAVNGAARSSVGLGDARWKKDIDPIWADNPEIEGTKKDLGPIIDLGLKLCKS